MKCPNCNYENRSNSKFCYNCGVEISAFKRQERQKNAPEENHDMEIITCPKCGSNISYTCNTCPICHYPIDSHFEMLQMRNKYLAIEKEIIKREREKRRERIYKEQSDYDKRLKVYTGIALVHAIALIACVLLLIKGFDIFLSIIAAYCTFIIIVAVVYIWVNHQAGMPEFHELGGDPAMGLDIIYPEYGQSIAEYNSALFDWFYNDLRNNQLPTIPSPTQAEIIEYNREREARLSRISAPATEETWYDPEKIKANESIPIEIVIWVDKVYNYYFESLRQQLGVIYGCDGARASLYEYKGYHYYTVSETHPHVYVD